MKRFKKTIIKILIVILCLPIISLTFFGIDMALAGNYKKPIFCLKNMYLDGGTIECYGLGYQIIIWHKLSDEPGVYLVGVEAHYFAFNSTKEPQIELTRSNSKLK